MMERKMHQRAKEMINTQEIPLDQRISFRLQRIGTLLTMQALNLLKRAGGLTLNQWRMLSFLSERDSGSAQELAKLGLVDKATMSRAAAELQKRGLIESQVSDLDRRSTVRRLTKEGRDMVELIAPLMMSRQSELISALTEAEHESLFRSLEKLEVAINESSL